MGVVVIGVGNPWRGDDGVGWAVADAVVERLAGNAAGVEVVVSDGEPGRLLAQWEGADLAVVVDAVRCGDRPGVVRRVDDLGRLAAPAAGSHATGLADAVALATAVGMLPGRLVVLGVEAGPVGAGRGLSPAVAAAVAPAAAEVARLVRAAVRAGAAGPSTLP